jgi:mono/diheme cytochrome c family protein
MPTTSKPVLQTISNPSPYSPLAVLLYAVGLLFFAAVPTAAQMKMFGSAQAGFKLFNSAALSTNGLSCSTCHAHFDEDRIDDGRLRPGHSLFNSSHRETWWGQDPDDPASYQSIGAASVVCVEHFMRNPDKLTAQQLLDLDAYLANITLRSITDPLALAPAADKTGQYAGFDGGDKFVGRDLFYAACHACHPNGNSGIGPDLPRDKDPAFYARKVREGDGLGTVLSGLNPNAYDPREGLFMPFFGADRLSDTQMRHIIAFIRASAASR